MQQLCVSCLREHPGCLGDANLRLCQLFVALSPVGGHRDQCTAAGLSISGQYSAAEVVSSRMVWVFCLRCLYGSLADAILDENLYMHCHSVTYDDHLGNMAPRFLFYSNHYRRPRLQSTFVSDARACNL